MPKPTLYIFAISHYCEKARWALDHFGVDYRVRHVMPGLNRSIAKKLGGKGGALPFLHTDAALVQGSSAIIDWAEANRAEGRASISGNDPATIAAMEKRLDDVAGVHIRRTYYSEALLDNPASVRPIFSRDLPLLQKWAITLGWSKVVPVMIKGMDLGREQGLQSRAILAAELDWLDGVLSDGRLYLDGKGFSRADMTAASLLAPLVNPAEHPTYSALSLPPQLAEVIDGWKDRPSLRWVRDMYARHR